MTNKKPNLNKCKEPIVNHKFFNKLNNQAQPKINLKFKPIKIQHKL